MWFKILGPVEVRPDNSEGSPRIELGADMQRRLVALLTLSPGEVFANERIVDALWPVDPPRNAVKTVQVYVYRLRRELGPAAIVARRGGGYRLAARPEDVDGHLFVELVRRAEACRAQESAAEAYDLLEQALGHWTGTPYADLPDFEAVRAEVERLTEWRMRALELRAELALERGGHADVLPELLGLVTAHPYRERFGALLMLALYRSGRQADALEQFRRTRRLLTDELGVEPGPELRRLHEQILGCDPALEPPVIRTDPDEETDAPAQLPPALTSFAGRTTELEDLLALAESADREVVVVTVDGMAGVGKTVFAVAAAHRLAAGFPDGQVFVDLHGFTSGAEPSRPGAVLDRLLRGIGVPGHRIPYDAEDRAALWRTRLQGRRMLIVLDNAATEDQVRPILPGAPGCLVLVTSRRRLTGLDDTRTITLDTLPAADAIRLFTEIAPRAATQPAEVLATAVSLCGGLPLAIRLAAARWRSRPGWRLADLIDRLGDEHLRLEELTAGERSVQGAFEVSYRHLDAGRRRAFRLLGLHPGHDFCAYAVAALADVGRSEAERWLEDLVDLNLVQSPGYGRYTLHDLLRVHAADAAGRDEPAEERDRAIDRLTGFYLHTASRAAARIEAPQVDYLTEVPAISTPSPPVPDVEQALAWMDRERGTLVSLAMRSTEQASMFSAVLFRYLSNGAYYAEAEAVHTAAVEATRQRDDRREEGLAVNRLAVAHAEQGDYGPAETCFRQAHACAVEVGDSRRERIVLENLAVILRYQGAFGEALLLLSQALELGASDPVGELRSLVARATALTYLGAYDEAEDIAGVVLPGAREHGELLVEADTLLLLGLVHQNRAGYAEALATHREAHRKYGVIGVAWGANLATTHAGNALRGLGRLSEALKTQTESLAVARELGFRMGTAEALQGLGETLRAAGRPDEALGRFREALEIAEELRQRPDQGWAHEALGLSYRDLGVPERADEHLRKAYDIYADLGMPEADRILVP